MKRFGAALAVILAGCIFGDGKDPTVVIEDTPDAGDEPEVFETIRTTDANCAAADVSWGVVRPPVKAWDIAALGEPGASDLIGFAGARGEGSTLIVDFAGLDLAAIGAPATSLRPNWVSTTYELPGPVEVWDVAIFAGPSDVPATGDFVHTEGFVLTNHGVVECGVVAEASPTGTELRGAECALGSIHDVIVREALEPVRSFLVSAGCNHGGGADGWCPSGQGRYEFIFGLVNGADQAYGLDVISGWKEDTGLRTGRIALPNSIATQTTEEPDFDFAPHFTLPIEPGGGIGFPRLGFLAKTADGQVRPRTTTFSHEDRRFTADESSADWALPASLRSVLPGEFAFASNVTGDGNTKFGFAGFDRDGSGIILSRPDGYPDAAHARWAVEGLEIDGESNLSFVPGFLPVGVVASGTNLLVFNWDIDNDQVEFQRIEMAGASELRTRGGIADGGAAGLVGDMMLDGSPAVWVVPVASIPNLKQSFCSE